MEGQVKNGNLILLELSCVQAMQLEWTFLKQISGHCESFA